MPERDELIEKAKTGDREAVTALYRPCENKVSGFIRARTATDDEAKEVAQETWTKVWEKISTYDPSRSSFCTFAKFWARIMLLRHYQAKREREKVEQLSSELRDRFSDVVEDTTDEEILTILAIRQQAREENPDDEDANRDKLYLALLCLTFNGTSPAHQLIAFGFVKLLEWTPRDVVAQLSDIVLRDLKERLEVAYLNKSQLSDDQIEPCFAGLRAKMDHLFKDTVNEQKTLTTHPLLHERIVGDTTLRDYYTKQDARGQAANIEHWWHAVTRRVEKDVKKSTHGPLFDVLNKSDDE